MKRAVLLLLPLALASCAAPSGERAAASAAPAGVVAPTAAELVQARQAGMHMAATLLYQGILPRAKGTGDLKDVHYPEGISLWAAAIPGLFPSGSAHPQSRAKDSIWTNKPDFDSKARALGAAADRVTAAGKLGDRAAYAEAAEQLRAACSSCHSAYRKD